jgi:xanthine dehydrogenase accessory factor
MSDLRLILKLWREARDRREEVCLATVVGIEGSSYRKPGARMLITSGGRRAGTISGGCLEAEVQKKAWWLTEAGSCLQRYSSFYDDDSEMPYGLGCGGTVSVLLERGEAAERVLAALERSLASRKGTAFVSVIESESPGELGTRLILPEDGDRNLTPASRQTVALGHQALHERRSLWHQGKETIFAEYLAPRVALVVVGAGDDAVPLVELAGSLGWKTTVLDGRTHLATRERFPMADEVVAREEFDQIAFTPRDAAVVLTHSYQQDRAALRGLLPSNVGYLGVLGPRKRTERLLSEIAPELRLTVGECMARLHSPVGLDIGSKDPTSIALAITAEIYSMMERAADTQRENASPPLFTSREFTAGARYPRWTSR